MKKSIPPAEQALSPVLPAGLFMILYIILCVKVSAEVRKRINGDLASGFDVLHDEFHNVLRNGDTAPCIGTVYAE